MADNSGIVWDDKKPKNNSDIVWDDDKPTPKAPQKPMTAGQVLIGAAQHAIPSTVNLVSDIYQTFRHPIDTVKSLGALGSSVLGAVGITDADPAMAQAVGQYLSDRYGGVENIKRSLAQDPAGILADAASLLGGGGMALKAAKLGRAANAANKVASFVDPLSLAGKGFKFLPKAGQQVLGFTTGAGPTAIGEAARSGFVGGDAGRAFRDQMRGGDVRSVIDVVEPALKNMRADRTAKYKADMAALGQDVVPLDFGDIQTRLAGLDEVGKYKGVDINRPAAEATQNIKGVVDEWSNFPPQEFHTPEGLDALKQKIGNESKNYLPGSPSRIYADSAYNAVKESIVDRAPEYARTMKDYEEASNILREMETSLSLKRKTPADTKIRKLQSIMRNNANTNYGRREELGRILEDKGATTLFPMLAGQALNTWTPRGLSGNLTGAAAVAQHAPSIVQSIVDPTFYAQLAASSPRLVGEFVHGAGRVAGATKPLAPIAQKLSNQKLKSIIYQLRQRELPQEDTEED
jgi:hypothetical protein